MKKQSGFDPIHKSLGTFPGLEETPELSTDLVWSLGKDTPETELLAKALIYNYGRNLDHLARAYLDERESADIVVQGILVETLIETRHFGEKTELDAWLFCLAAKRLIVTRKLSRVRNFFRRSPGHCASAKAQDGLEAALWLGFDQLRARPRLTLLLRALFGWGIDEIARVMEETPGHTGQVIEIAEKRILHLVKKRGIPPEKLTAEDLPVQLDEALCHRWPPEPAQPQAAETSLHTILEQADRRKQNRKKASRVRLGVFSGLPILLILVVMLVSRWSDPSEQLQEWINPPTPVPTLPSRMHYTVSEGDSLEEIAAQFHTSVNRLKASNALKDDLLRQGRDLLIPAQAETWKNVPPTPLPKNTLPPRPLSDRSTVHEVLAKMHASSSLWRTAWVDMYNLTLGPAGYAGPPQQNHFQLWISQPGGLLIISQDPTSNNESSQLVWGGLVFDFYYPIIQVRRSNQSEAEPFTSYLFNIRNDESFNHPETWKMIGLDSLAGRNAIVMEWDPEELSYPVWKAVFLRFWVDTLTGTTLRQQVFIKGDTPTLYMDSITLKAYFDIDLPASIFDPFQAAKMVFSEDYLGTPAEPKYLKTQMERINQLVNVPEHQRYKRKDPPKGFDPSPAKLTFQYAQAINPIADTGQPVSLFADGYFLTELPYFNPLNARCTRSTDGAKIAYSDPNTENEAIGQSRGGWIDLHQPQKLNKFAVNQPINEMVFSPDGRYLAYTETDYSIYGNIYILDTESGETRELNRFETAYSLAWSPDGQELALITLENDAYTALVVDVKTGKITYSVHVKAFYAWDEKEKPADWPAPDWPGHAWNIQFPVTTRGLDGCYLP